MPYRKVSYAEQCWHILRVKMKEVPVLPRFPDHPCPHCGGEAYLERNHRAFINAQTTRVAFVRCTVCNAHSGRYKLGEDPVEARRLAVEAWNRRAD